jgi:hypothetical protein
MIQDRRVRLITFPIIAFLGACSSLPSTSHEPQEAWLVGGWIPFGEDCESDAGVRFLLDGSFLTYEAAGTWTLAGPTLTTVITHRWESGGDASDRPVPPEPQTERIEVTGRDSYRSRRSRDEIVEMRRCRM